MLLWERQAGKKVKVLRTDRGKEYLGDLERHLKSQGINHQTSVTYTPAQNGRAERINRTLIEKARAMLLTHGLPKDFWGAAMVTAAQLRNVTLAAHQCVTPFELFWGRPPDTSRLRVFGCTAYVLVPEEKRKKFDSRAESGVFVGYSTSSKAWKVLVWRNGKPTLIEAASVRFFEDQTPDLSKMTDFDFTPMEEEPSWGDDWLHWPRGTAAAAEEQVAAGDESWGDDWLPLPGGAAAPAGDVAAGGTAPTAEEEEAAGGAAAAAGDVAAGDKVAAADEDEAAGGRRIGAGGAWVGLLQAQPQAAGALGIRGSREGVQGSSMGQSICGSGQAARGLAALGGGYSEGDVFHL
jgi:hypothetical protein